MHHFDPIVQEKKCPGGGPWTPQREGGHPLSPARPFGLCTGTPPLLQIMATPLIIIMYKDPDPDMHERRHSLLCPLSYVSQSGSGSGSGSPLVHHLRTPRRVFFADYIRNFIMDAWRHTLRLRTQTRTRTQTRISVKGDIAYDSNISVAKFSHERLRESFREDQPWGPDTWNVLCHRFLSQGLEIKRFGIGVMW